MSTSAGRAAGGGGSQAHTTGEVRDGEPAPERRLARRRRGANPADFRDYSSLDTTTERRLLGHEAVDQMSNDELARSKPRAMPAVDDYL